MAEDRPKLGTGHSIPTSYISVIPTKHVAPNLVLSFLMHLDFSRKETATWKHRKVAAEKDLVVHQVCPLRRVFLFSF